MSDYDECTDSLVDPAVLLGLQAELGGDASIVTTFVKNYVELLPWRVARLHQSLVNLDMEDAMDAVLSLKTSSHMVGAVCIERLAAELEVSMKLLPGGDHLMQLSPQLDEIDRFVFGTICELRHPN